MTNSNNTCAIARGKRRRDALLTAKPVRKELR